ncbi:signal recognition particle protein [Telmatocola sphagniphila]|uniref:Signal recognition particle protein n=1 Tax=Telmatocola sphagniphila TaxID=1123043 RepID=A0A8E6EV33_9BACT|nr:signal recognition particle protein [Telmatocola sphagniphila]QVL34429.1 signal recognition particle protein [Telmatocola sphagniphila]
MFEGIQRGLTDAFKKLRGRGKLTADNVREGLGEVRRALLEADVNFNVVNEFIEKVEARSVGQEVLSRVDPSEQIIKIVFDELVALMGPVDHRIPFAKDRPTVIMMCGLQGAGKTTTCGKLALKLKAQNRKVLLVAADLQRPAAVEQLKVIGGQTETPVYTEATNPVDVCRNAVNYAKMQNLDTVILDTAGRLHIDEELIEELKQIDKYVKPDSVFLVCDAMTGQDAVNSSKAFHDALELNGVILTKLDGDARGGAALSIRQVAGVPIKFIGMGEKLQALEDFHPERMASRLMGQGDLMGLVEKVSRVQQEISEEEIKKQQEKLAKGSLTLEDFRNQFVQLQKMGMKDMIGMMPGMSDMIPKGEDPEVALKRVQGMIDSMTMEERRNPDLIDIPRRRRIAAGSGVQPHEVNQFLKQFEVVQNVFKQMSQMSIWQRMKMMTGLGNMGAFMPGGENLLKQIGKKGDTGHRKTAKERAEERKKKKKKGR